VIAVGVVLLALRQTGAQPAAKMAEVVDRAPVAA
jgi:hypothetical protein